ncbi:MAG: DsbE family thiol:disulfide interchange protein, partial [Mesorhizobium sp.]
VLLALSKDRRFVLAALNYKDEPENARRFLGEVGNPYQAIGVDEAGRAAIDWGVYGVPETFVVGKDGKIAYKHVGPITAESAETLLLPQIEKALAAH